ncbi:Uncharacterised protein [Salmonella enterica subsp. enterica serovar Bovismorbificans]|nr:Uncharacterised protein [Salmonella enterica subsp. enterica serovar Bovismorbificans]
MRRKCLLDFMNVTNNLRLRKHIERRGVLARQSVQIDPFKTQMTVFVLETAIVVDYLLT